MKIIFPGAAIAFMLLLIGCGTENPSPDESRQADEITRQLADQEHISGGLNPFKLIENPLYNSVREIDHLETNDKVFITWAGGELRVYPHRHMHVEVVNEEINGVVMAITYCPITRSGINWNRLVGVDTLLLTASGYLYKENMMPLDVNSGHIWSQMLMRRFDGNVGQGDIFTYRDLRNLSHDRNNVAYGKGSLS